MPRDMLTQDDVDFILGVMLLFLAIVIYIVEVPKTDTVKGTVDKVEVISVAEFFWGDTFFVKVKFKDKKTILLRGDKKKVQIEKGKVYKINFYPEDGAIRKIELIE